MPQSYGYWLLRFLLQTIPCFILKQIYLIFSLFLHKNHLFQNFIYYSQGGNLYLPTYISIFFSNYLSIYFYPFLHNNPSILIYLNIIQLSFIHLYIQLSIYLLIHLIIFSSNNLTIYQQYIYCQGRPSFYFLGGGE